MSDRVRIFTTVSAVGRHETAFKSVQFRLTTESVGPDTADARAQADAVIAKVIEAVQKLNADGAGIDLPGLVCTYAQNPHHVYNHNTRQNVPNGYRVIGTIRCSTDRIDAVTAIQDALSKIDGASVQAPQFFIDDSPQARALAFKDAHARATQDFALQCAVLGVDPNDFEIVSYSPTQDMSHLGGAETASLGPRSAAVDGGPAEIRPGGAEITAFISLTYARKDKAPDRPYTS